MNPILKNYINSVVEKRAWELNPGTLDKVFNHHTGTAMLGAGVGAGAGALIDSKNRLRGAGIGALAGGAGGYGLSKAFPEKNQAVIDFLTKYTLRKPVGRVVTNTIPPIGYDTQGDLKELKKEHSMLDFIKSIIKDEPVYKKQMMQEGYFDRDVPYRKAFDQKPRYGLDVYKDNPDGSIGFDMENQRGMRNILEVLDPTAKQHSLMKNYNRSFKPDGETSYSDRWDWDFHSGEKIKHPMGLARYFVNRIAKPVDIKGSIPGPLAKEIRQLADIPEPILKKSSMEAGNVFQNFIKDLKTNPEFVHNKVIPTLDKIFSHHTTSAGLGALGGGVVGALSDKKNRLRNAALGAGVGASAGLGFSNGFPEQSERLNDTFVSHMLRKPIGKIITNIGEPRGYNQIELLKKKLVNNYVPEEIRPQLPINSELNKILPTINKPKAYKDLAQSIYYDKPWMHDTRDLSNADKAREPLFREMFDLPQRYGKDIWNIERNKTNLHFEYNPKNEIGAQALDNILKEYSNKDPRDIYAMSSYARAGGAGKPVTYKDIWDFNLHPNETFDSSEKWIRYFIDRLIRKPEISGTINPEIAAQINATLGHKS